MVEQQPGAQQAAPEVDFGPPPPRPGNNNMPKGLQQLARLIEQIMAAHAGGFNSPVQVEIEGQPTATTPAQLLNDMCEAVIENTEAQEELTKAIDELIESLPQVDDDEEEERPRKRKRR